MNDPPDIALLDKISLFSRNSHISFCLWYSSYQLLGLAQRILVKPLNFNILKCSNKIKNNFVEVKRQQIKLKKMIINNSWLIKM